MKCGRVRVWLSEFAADGVDPRRAADFHAHLATCPRCAAEWQAVEAANAALAAHVVPDPGNAFFARLTMDLNERLDAVAPRTGWAWVHGVRRLAALGATGCLVLAAGLVLHVGKPADQPPLAAVVSVAPDAEPTPVRVAAVPTPVAPKAVVQAPAPAPRLRVAATASAVEPRRTAARVARTNVPPAPRPAAPARPSGPAPSAPIPSPRPASVTGFVPVVVEAGSATFVLRAPDEPASAVRMAAAKADGADDDLRVVPAVLEGEVVVGADHTASGRPR